MGCNTAFTVKHVGGSINRNLNRIASPDALSRFSLCFDLILWVIDYVRGLVDKPLNRLITIRFKAATLNSGLSVYRSSQWILGASNLQPIQRFGDLITLVFAADPNRYRSNVSRNSKFQQWLISTLYMHHSRVIHKAVDSHD
jgi:hypothetical protein